jgi:hypothetical protein
MSPQSTSAADQLPGALLARILQHVPLQQRLASCALVCKSWKPAAAAATDKLSLTVQQPGSKSAATEGPAADPSSISMTARQPEESCLELSGVTAWLQQHGSNLNSLQLQCIIPGQFTTDVKAQLQLPCPALVQLTSLSLGSCVVSTLLHGPQQASAAVSTQALPQLVDLKLMFCKFTSPASFQQLASATGLTALELQHVWWDDSPQPPAAASTGSPPSALAAVLQACSGVRKLRLLYWQRDSVVMPLSSLAVLSGLQQLEDFAVYMPKTADVTPLPDLSTKLTRLNLRVPSGSLAVLNLSRLQQLQDLSMFLPVVAGAAAGLPLPDLPSGLTRLVVAPKNPDVLSADGYSYDGARRLQLYDGYSRACRNCVRLSSAMLGWMCLPCPQ